MTFNHETRQTEVDWEKWKASGRQLPDVVANFKEWNVNGILDAIASGQTFNITSIPESWNEMMQGMREMTLTELARSGVTFNAVTGEAVVDWDRLASTGRQISPGLQTQAQQMAEQRYAQYAASL